MTRPLPTSQAPHDQAKAAAGFLDPGSAVSIITPTYREVDNLAPLIARLAAVRDSIDFDLWIMDDQSRDGSLEKVAALNLPWVHFIERAGPRGLSLAVLDGFARAPGDILVVMDADLSHPPESIPALVAPLLSGAEMTIGSRYVPGGSADAAWGFRRFITSKAAMLLARPLVALSDPLSGFFAVRRDVLDRATRLNPVGWKIALEIIVRARVRNVVEVPIHFADRTAGKSKLGPHEMLRYLAHLRRLYACRLGLERTHGAAARIPDHEGART